MSFTELVDFDTVTIQAPVISQDSSGGATRAFQVVDTVSARVESLSSQQRLQFDQLQIPVTHRVFVDGQTGITNGYLLTTSSGLSLRVVGVEQRNALGGISDFAVILADEIKE